jgi:hypothetical protein
MIEAFKGIGLRQKNPIYIRWLHLFGYSIKITVESPRPDAERLAATIADRVKEMLTNRMDASYTNQKEKHVRSTR